MMHQPQTDSDHFQERQNYQAGQQYDEENNHHEDLNDEYPDTYQIEVQKSDECQQVDQPSSSSARKGSVTTNHTNNENNVSINLNDSKSQNNIKKGNQVPENTFQIDGCSRKFQRHMGHTIGFFNIKGEPIFTIGPHFILFLITWSCMTGFSYFLTFKISANKGDFWYYLTMLIGGGQSLSYLLTALINPGINTAKYEGQSNKRLNNYCSKCDINQSKSDYHCPDCDVCINEFDHHCPWTGKCIGGGNMGLFKVFISFTILWFFYSMVLLIS